MGVDYSDSRDPRWTRAVYDAIVAGTLTMTVRDGEAVTVTVSGECPRCEHQFTDLDILRAAVGIGEPRDTDQVQGKTAIQQLPPAILRCTCSVPHRNRVGEKSGCGIRFSVIAASGGSDQRHG